MKSMEEIVNGFQIVNHVTCFSLVHVASGMPVVRRNQLYSDAFRTYEEAATRATQYLPWYYGVSYKHGRKLTWIGTGSQDVLEASRIAREYAHRFHIPGQEYGISRTNEPWLKS